MFCRNLIVLIFITQPLNALPSNLDDINREVETCISTFLEPKEIRQFSQTSRRFRDLTNGSDSANFLRNQSKFTVTTADGRKYFLDEYLHEPETLPVSELKNIENLMQDRPVDFLKVLIKSAPQTPKSIKPNLKSFYKEILQIDKLIDTLPTYDTPQHNLAAILLELTIWAEIKTRVRAGTWDQFEEEIEHSLVENLDEQLDWQVINQLGAEVWGQLGAQIGTQVWEQVEDHNLGDMTEIFNKLQFTSNLQTQAFKEALIPTIKYFLMMHQLTSFVMRHSAEFKDIHTKFAEFISETMTYEQIAKVLNRLVIPNAPAGNYLVETQLNLIIRYLPTKSKL